MHQPGSQLGGIFAVCCLLYLIAPFSITVADFRAGKIRSYRTYFDDLSLIEQIAGV